MALTLAPETIGELPNANYGVFGAVIDVPMARGSVALVALADGTSSMYTSTGGGIIGAGTHAQVKEANSSLLRTLVTMRHEFLSSAETELPPSTIVRFHLLTDSGRKIADISAELFWKPSSHPLLPAVSAAQNFISALRSV